MNAKSPLIRSGEGKPEQFSWGRIEWLVSGALGSSTTMTFGRVTIEPGKANAIHRHPNCDEILYLVSGELEHSAGDMTYRMRAGDTIVLRAGVRHRATAIGSEEAVMLVCYSSPERQVIGE